MMKESAFVSLVVYVYNVENTIEAFLQRLDAFISSKFESFEIILVNDASTDNTTRAILDVKSVLKGNVVIVNMPWRHKREAAIFAGVDMSIGDFVYEIDSTVMDYPVELLFDLYRKSTEGFDIVSASPRVTKWGARLFYALMNKISYLTFDLTIENPRIITRRAINAVSHFKERTRYRKVLYKFSGYAFSTLLYDKQPGCHYKDESLSDKLSLAGDIIFLFSTVGLKVSAVLSLMFLSVSVLSGFYAIYMYLTLKTIVEGWTTLMLVLSFGLSGVFLVLSLISKYMTILLTEIQGRPHYTIKSVHKAA